MSDTSRGLLDLIIARLAGLKARERAALCSAFQTEDELLRCSFAELQTRAGGQRNLGLESGSRFLDEARRMAERDFAITRARHIGYVSIAEPGYPPLLREIYDPPAVIFYSGAFPLPHAAVAVVGTRKPDAVSLEAVYRLARELGEAGVAVVSGLALGVDAMAHRGNLDGGGKTAAVLGSAVDMVYPASNRQLARRMLDGGGSLLSEYPPGTPPQKWRFPERNRIIAGLCPAVLVAAAPPRSGALITADFALEQNRDLYVAADENGPFGEGCKKLAEEGAPLVKSADTILEALHIRRPEKIRRETEPSLSSALAEELGLVSLEA